MIARDGLFEAVGWWHPQVRMGHVHEHPEKPGRSWSVVMHRRCEPVYRRNSPDAESVIYPSESAAVQDWIENGYAVCHCGARLGRRDTVWYHLIDGSIRCGEDRIAEPEISEEA